MCAGGVNNDSDDYDDYDDDDDDHEHDHDDITKQIWTVSLRSKAKLVYMLCDKHLNDGFVSIVGIRQCM